MKGKKSSFIEFPIFRIGVTAGVAVLILAVVWGMREYAIWDREVSRDLQTTEQERRRILENTDRDAVQTIAFMRASIRDDLRDALRHEVEQALAIAGGPSVARGTSAHGRANADVFREALRNVRFNSGQGYYFAFDLDGVEQLYPPDPKLEGLAMLGLGDQRARVVADMLDIVKKNGEGFYSYSWSKPGVPGSDHRKTAFVKLFKPLNWVVGTGKYVEDFEAAEKAQALTRLKAIKFSDTGTIFAGTWDGISLLGPGQGQNMWDVTDSRGLKVVQELVKVAKQGGGFVQYMMPAIDGGRPYRKIAYVSGVPDWHWYVGAGDSLEAIESDVAKRRVLGRQQITGEVGVIGSVCLTFIVVIALQMRFVGGRARSDFLGFLGFLRKAANTNVSIDPNKMKFAEFAEMAAAADRMITERHEALMTAKRRSADLDRANEMLEQRVFERTRDLESQVAERLYAEDQLKAVNETLELRVEERTRALRDEIEARERVEEQFIQAQKMEAVGQLAGGFAHDFNNALTVIVGTLGAVRERFQFDEIGVRTIELAQEATRRASNLTRRMLIFSREMQTRPETIDLHELMLTLEGLISRALKESIEFSVVCGPGLWTVHVDPVLLENAVVNIALNAQDAMSDGGRFSLRVDNRRIDEAEAAGHRNARPGDYVEIAMSDTGTGIPPEYIERIFEPFFTTKDPGKGTGLGLSMVRTFVERSDGFVAVTSEIDRGTTVSLFIPRGAGTISTTKSETAKPVGLSLAGKRVLLVEDDQLVRETAACFLQSRDIEVVEVETGVDALSAMEDDGPFDLVISDLIMPGGISGVALHQLMQEGWPDCPFLLMTGYSHDEFERLGVDPESIRLLHKPFSMDELLEALKSMAHVDRPWGEAG